MKIRNVDEKVRTGRFFYDFSFDELIEVLEEMKTESVENYHAMMPYAQALYDHVSKNYATITTLSRFMNDVRMSLIEELVSRVLNNTVICLPCNIGDTAYTYKFTFLPADEREFEIIPKIIRDIQYNALENKIMISDGISFKELGKEIFLTREEAENYLNR